MRTAGANDVEAAREPCLQQQARHRQNEIGSPIVSVASQNAPARVFLALRLQATSGVIGRIGAQHEQRHVQYGLPFGRQAPRREVGVGVADQQHHLKNTMQVAQTTAEP